MKPVIRPSVKPRRGETPGITPPRPLQPLIATSNGTSAMNATAGCPYFGNESASSAPDTIAAAIGAEIICAICAFCGLADDPGFELLFFLQLCRHRISLVAILVLADADAEHRRRALGWSDHVRWISLRGQSRHNRIGLSAQPQRGHLDLVSGTGRRC